MLSNKFLIKGLGIACLVLLVLSIIGFTMYSNTKEKLRIADFKTVELTNLLASSQDTLKHYKGADGQNKARISILETARVETLLELQAKDKQIQWLQAVVKANKETLKNPGDAVIVIEDDNTRSEKYEDKTPEIQWEQRFVSKDFSDEWLNLSFFVDKDTTGFDVKTKNKYSLVLGTDKEGKRFADITNYNPYTTTKTLRTYQMLDDTPLKKRKKWGIGISTGYFITKDGLRPGIGLGINYNLRSW